MHLVYIFIWRGKLSNARFQFWNFNLFLKWMYYNIIASVTSFFFLTSLLACPCRSVFKVIIMSPAKARCVQLCLQILFLDNNSFSENVFSV